MSGGFQDLGLLPELVKATQDMGWVLPSDVQDEAIPLMLGGGDVMVVSTCMLADRHDKWSCHGSVHLPHRLPRQGVGKQVHSLYQPCSLCMS